MSIVCLILLSLSFCSFLFIYNLSISVIFAFAFFFFICILILFNFTLFYVTYSFPNLCNLFFSQILLFSSSFTFLFSHFFFILFLAPVSKILLLFKYIVQLPFQTLSIMVLPLTTVLFTKWLQLSQQKYVHYG